jgi:hypothetical protein
MKAIVDKIRTMFGTEEKRARVVAVSESGTGVATFWNVYTPNGTLLGEFVTQKEARTALSKYRGHGYVKAIEVPLSWIDETESYGYTGREVTSCQIKRRRHSQRRESVQSLSVNTPRRLSATQQELNLNGEK